MSIILLSDNHINTLVSYASLTDLRYYFEENWHSVRDNEKDIALELFRINENAYDITYPHLADKSLAKFFKFDFVDLANAQPVQIIKAVEAYEYQCDCLEHWKLTLAASLMKCIKNHAIGCLPGYDDAFWTIA